MSETIGLKNINMLSMEQFNEIANPTDDELWAVETETYSDDDGNWYRIYPDGWCEQGGINSNNSTTARTQVLLKPFRDTKYVVQVTYNGGDNSVSNGAILVYQKTINDFQLLSYSSDTCCWEAKGYIA